MLIREFDDILRKESESLERKRNAAKYLISLMEDESLQEMSQSEIDRLFAKHQSVAYRALTNMRLGGDVDARSEANLALVKAIQRMKPEVSDAEKDAFLMKSVKGALMNYLTDKNKKGFSVGKGELSDTTADEIRDRIRKTDIEKYSDGEDESIDACARNRDVKELIKSMPDGDEKKMVQMMLHYQNDKGVDWTDIMRNWYKWDLKRGKHVRTDGMYHAVNPDKGLTWETLEKIRNKTKHMFKGMYAEFLESEINPLDLYLSLMLRQ